MGNEAYRQLLWGKPDKPKVRRGASWAVVKRIKGHSELVERNIFSTDAEALAGWYRDTMSDTDVARGVDYQAMPTYQFWRGQKP